MLRCGMGERPTILLADDEEAITAELQPFLERAGFAVLVARDGEAALAASLASDPDLIVLDVLMPGLDGREVLRRLRARALQPGRAAHAGRRRGRARDGARGGADDYLNKPFDRRTAAW